MAATITGKVFDDLNQNGRYDAGEPGIPGVFLTLYNKAGSSVSVQTDANGAYSFVVPTAGGYAIRVTEAPLDHCPPTAFSQPAGCAMSNKGQDTVTAALGVNLVVSKTGVPSPVSHGQMLTYRIVATNYGAGTAQNLQLIDDVPPEVEDVTFSLDNGVSWSPWLGSCGLGAIMPNSSRRVLIRGTVSQAAAGVILNTATVKSDPSSSSPADCIAHAVTGVAGCGNS